MWSKIANSRIFYAVLSVICAFGCWLYVDITQAPNTEVTIHNVPVVFNGEDLLADEGLMITDGKDANISVVLNGPRSTLYQLNKGNVTANVQAAAQISSEGTYQLEYTIQYPSTLSTSNVRVKSRSLSNIPVTVVQMTSKTLKIEGLFNGTTIEGALFNDKDFQFEVDEVNISGERSAVERIEHATVVLDAKNLEATWSGSLPLSFTDEDGNPVDMTDVTCDVSSVFTVFPIKIVKEVPLKVNFIENGGATVNDIEFEISPKVVSITGRKEQLDEIDALTIGTISLSDVVTKDVFTFDIATPDNVSVLNGEPSADVTVTMKAPLTVRTVETTNVEFVNVPEGLAATLAQDSIIVRIRGTADVMDIVLDSDVIISADLNGVTEEDIGNRIVDAKVSVKGFASVGAVGKCQIVVDISKAETDN